jgi:hypothetical protein
MRYSDATLHTMGNEAKRRAERHAAPYEGDEAAEVEAEWSAHRTLVPPVTGDKLPLAVRCQPSPSPWPEA